MYIFFSFLFIAFSPSLFCGKTIAETERQKKLFSAAVEEEPVAMTYKSLPGWMTSLDEATRVAKESNKSLLIACVGAQWCPWSKRMISDVLSRPEFIDALKSDFVLVWCDFPISASEPASSCSALKEKYKIQLLPTLILTTSSGEEISSYGYLAMEPKEFAQHIEDSLHSYQELSPALSSLGSLGGELLQELYTKAVKAGFAAYREKILEAGLKSSPTAFFLLERYADLLKVRSRKDPEVARLREKICKADPKNQNKTQFRLAMLDFEKAAAHQEKDKEIKRALKPLLEYVEKWGESDQENLWRVEMALAQFLFSKGKLAAAIEHAKASQRAVPEESRVEVMQTVDYLIKYLETHSENKNVSTLE
jgi:protein disulfide-isomerase